MELLYIWIEDYKNIKRQGFNFSPKHRFDFVSNELEGGNVKSGTLKHQTTNEDYPSNFFGDEITNITAIIGANGSGKSNMLEWILSKLCTRD